MMRQWKLVSFIWNHIFVMLRDSKIKLTPHKRYTMKDIGALEIESKILKSIQLFLLETDTKFISQGSNTGLDNSNLDSLLTISKITEIIISPEILL